MTTDKFWTFPQIADRAAQNKESKHWRSHADDYLGDLVGDYWRGRFEQVFHHPMGFWSQPPDPITREVTWKMLGGARPLAFHGVKEREYPDWEALAEVPSEDYGVGCSPPGIRNTILAQHRLSEVDAHNWIRRQGQAKPSPGRPAKWDWDGAVAHLLAVANTPDGLPENQAKVELLVAEWFHRTYDCAPAESAIRKHVQPWCKDVFRKASK